MAATPHPNARNALRTALAAQLRKSADDAYIKDLAAIVKDASPVLLDMLHKADGWVEFYFYGGALFLNTDGESKQLLP